MTKRKDALKDYLVPIAREFSAENSPLMRPRSHVTSGALQSMNDAISGLSSESEELRRKLSDGQTIIEIGPDVIDASIINDRLDRLDSEELNALTTSIKENGQALPVLVRPHPTSAGRYQLAFGHRRVAAVKRLGISVKAIVRELTDEELIIAQGNENLERKDLSFIERAVFAFRLENMGIARHVILATFGTNSKGVLSEMISLVRRLPMELVEAIGAAPGIGRPRWDELASYVAEAKVTKWRRAIENSEFERLQGAGRFDWMLRHLKSPDSQVERTGDAKWISPDKTVSVDFRSTAKSAVATYRSESGPNFANYIAGRMDDLFAEFQKLSNTPTGDQN